MDSQLLQLNSSIGKRKEDQKITLLVNEPIIFLWMVIQEKASIFKDDKLQVTRKVYNIS
jgi:hypothetical protein